MQKLLKSSVVPATATLTLLVLLAGCGQKGSLTLPAASPSAPAASTAAR
jgi:predicted small lipoprotein YifL